MKLYTINATAIRASLSYYDNSVRMRDYSRRVAQILSRHGIDGFTIYKVDGYWMGHSEESFKIEIATELSLDKVLEVCRELREEYDQDAVMLTLPDNSVEFIERP